MKAARTELTAKVAAAFGEAAGANDRNGAGGAGAIASHLVEHARLLPGWRVLDAGCGAGAVLIRAARAVAPGGQVFGVDLASGMLARAEREAERAGVRDRVVLSRGDAAAPAFGPASFDAILASVVFCLLPDPGTAAARWRELLVPGGTLAFARLVATDPRWFPVIAAMDAHASDAHGFDTHAHRPGPPQATTELLDGCGFAGVTSTIETITFRYDGPQQWWETAASEGPWLTWRHIPARQLAAARSEAIALAGKLCEPDGSLLRRARMTFVTAYRAEEG